MGGVQGISVLRTRLRSLTVPLHSSCSNSSGGRYCLCICICIAEKRTRTRTRTRTRARVRRDIALLAASCLLNLSYRASFPILARKSGRIPAILLQFRLFISRHHLGVWGSATSDFHRYLLISGISIHCRCTHRHVQNHPGTYICIFELLLFIAVSLSPSLLFPAVRTLFRSKSPFRICSCLRRHPPCSTTVTTLLYSQCWCHDYSAPHTASSSAE